MAKTDFKPVKKNKKEAAQNHNQYYGYYSYGVEPSVFTYLKDRVRYLTSLLSNHKRIQESIDSGWSADIKKNIVYWCPFDPVDLFKMTRTPDSGTSDAQTMAGKLNVIDEESFLYLTSHEASHIEETTEYKLPGPVDNKHEFHRWMNAFEDVRVDRLSAERFSSFSGFKENLCHRLYEDIWEVIYDELDFFDKVWLEATSNEINYKVKGSDQEVRDFHNKWWPTLSQACDDSKTTQQLVDKIYPIYKELQKHKQYQQDQKKKKQKGGGGGKGGESMDAPTLSLEELLELIKNDLDDPKGKLAQNFSKEEVEKLKQQIDYQIKSFKDFDKDNPNTRLPGGGIGSHTRNPSNARSDRWDAYKKQQLLQIKALVKHFQAILRHNAQDAWEGNKRRGKFDAKKAYRVLNGNYKVFKKKHAVGSFDYLVGVLVDSSGSMQNMSSRGTNLASTVVTIVEALEAMQIDYFVTVWETELVAIKPIHIPLNNKQKDNMIKWIDPPCGGTYESKGLMSAELAFKHTKNDKKILLSITDGQTSNPDESEWYLSRIRSYDVIDVGIGVGIPAPKHYTHRISVKNLNDLTRELPKIMGSLIKRGP